ncbi:hypothetical protein D7030_05135 [Flavobacteriaceae bacterium AU392]|nr:hypothetical protein D1817_11610 [Flavobacteriaceae bacterium]RKM86061.1 hypothetical protein D7030_05135 [Flavobacteriaceae bacterium AU392]
MLKNVLNLGTVLKREELKKIAAGSNWTCTRTKTGHQTVYLSGEFTESFVGAWGDIWSLDGWNTHCTTGDLDEGASFN